MREIAKAVLIICLTIQHTEIFQEEIEKIHPKAKIKLYMENDIDQ
jgi:hypothetical protein